MTKKHDVKFKHSSLKHVAGNLYFSHVFDNICSYQTGGIYEVYNGNVLVEREDTQQYWHRICFGFYRKSEHWVR